MVRVAKLVGPRHQHADTLAFHIVHLLAGNLQHEVPDFNRIVGRRDPLGGQNRRQAQVTEVVFVEVHNDLPLDFSQWPPCRQLPQPWSI